MAQSIEIPVSLGLQSAEGQVNHLRKILSEAVKIDSTAFRGLSQALQKAENDVAKLKSQMSTAFQSASGSKKFLSDYDKLFESLATIGNRFGFLKESEMIFSPENAEAIKNARSEMAQLSDEIQQIKSGKVGKLFEDDSVASIREVREVANDLGVTLSKTTFQDFGQKISGAMTNAQKDLDETRKQIELLKEAAKSADLKKDSIFSQLNIDKLMGNTAKVIDKNGAQTLRDQVAALYKEYGLNDAELGKNIRAGSHVDQVWTAEKERIHASADNFVDELNREKNRIQEAINNFSNINKNTADGKRANWQSKLAYTDKIKEQFKGLLSFTDASAELRSTGRGIDGYVKNFEKELKEGLEKLSTADIAEVLQKKVQAIFSNASTKSVITDLGSFKQQITVMMKEAFGDLNLGDVTSGISAGWDFDKAIEMVVANIKTALQNLDPKELEGKAEQYEATLKKLESASKTVGDTERASTGSLKEKEAAFQALVEEVTKYVAAQLGITTGQVQAVLRDDTDAANQGRAALEGYVQSLNKLQQKQQALGNIQSAVNRWMGFWQVLNMTKSAINDMKQHIQELDTVMTSISVVTNFSQEDLWGQISQYSEIARQYGVAIKGVYEVSQIYYQQGLQQNDVMTLTTETLKMARIAGLDYATAADYMTTAIRGFKLEMQDAAHVTDVFSALAATTASSTEEIAVAISKTASSAEAVGASFEATSAMMATMIATTRESATNIGTALKSVISRYGEMTSDPSKTVDSEGEEMSLNRVDKALQTVGITIHDTAGQFRDFDDVMLELMEKWDSLDSLSQRYIATLMAGNRQQSRFLALVSNVDEYKKALETATNAEGTGELQTLKTLDSIDAKIEKMKVTIQEFYTSSGLEDLYKGVLDSITNIVSAANNLPKAFGKIPGMAIAIGASVINAIKSALTLIINSIATSMEAIKGQQGSFLTGLIDMWRNAGKQAGAGFGDNANQALHARNPNSARGQRLGTRPNQPWYQTDRGKLGALYGGAALSLGSSALTLMSLNAYGASTSISQDITAGLQGFGGGLLGIAGSTLTGLARGGISGAIGGVITGLISQISTLTSSFGMLNVTTARQLQLAEKEVTETKNTAQKETAKVNELEKAINTYNELESKAYTSAEAMQEFKNHMNMLAESYPALISSMDENGNYIVQLQSLEGALAAARERSAIATANATKAELNRQNIRQTAFQNARNNLLRGVTNTNTGEQGQNLLLNRQQKIRTQGLDNWLTQRLGFDAETAIKTYNASNPISSQISFNADSDFNKLLQENQDKLIEFYSIYGSGMQSELAGLQSLHTSLVNTVESLQQADSELSVQELIGMDKVPIATDKEHLLLAYFTLQSRINDYLDQTDNMLNTVGNTLVEAQADVVLSSSSLNDDEDYKKRAKLISSLVGQNERLQELSKTDTDKSTVFEDAVRQETMEYLNFLDSREELYDILINQMQFSNFRSEMELSSYLTQYLNPKNDIERKIYDIYIDRFNTIQDKAYENYEASLKKYLSEEQVNEFQNLKLNTTSDGDFDKNDEQILNNKFLTQISSALPQYAKLQEKTPLNADNYLQSVLSTYTAISSLTGKLQEPIIDIMSAVDFSDQASIETAIDSISQLGTEYQPVVDALQIAYNNLFVNVKTQAEEIKSGLSDYVKTVETIFSSSTKELSYSDALKTAINIIDSNKDLSLDTIIKQNENGKYYLTSEAIVSQIQQGTADQQARLDILKTNTENNLSIYEAIINSQNEAVNAIIDSSQDNTRQSQNTLLAIDSILETLYTDETGKLDTNKFSAAQVQMEKIYAQYLEWITLDNNQNKSFVEYLGEESEALSSILTDTINLKENLTSDMAKSYLKSFDYTSIVSGKGTAQSKETLKALLQSSSDANFDDATFDHFYTALITGKIEEYNNWLKNYLGLGNYQVSEDQANRARFEALKSLYDKIASGDVVYSALEPQEQELLKVTNELAGFEATDMKNGANALLTAIWALKDAGVFSLKEMEDSIASTAETNFKNSNAGKQYNLLTSFKDGFTAQEAATLGLLDKETGELRSEFSDYLEQDSNGNWIVKAGQDAASVIQELARLLGISIDKTTDEYKDAIKDGIDQAIAEADKADIGKQRVNAWQSVMSGKVSDRISLADVDATTKSYMKAAGLISDLNADFVYIQSEEQLNKAIEWMRTKVGDKTWVSHNKQTARYFDNLVKDFDAKANKINAVTGVISQQVSRDAAESFALAFEGTTEKASEIMERMGAVWDNLSQSWIIDNEDLDDIEAYIDALEIADDGTNAAAITQMRTSLANLRDTFAYDEDRTLVDLIENYSNVSNEAIAKFNQYYGEQLQTAGKSIDEFIITDEFGNKTLKVVELQKALEEAGNNVDDLFKNAVASYADTYLESIEKVQGYVKSGTTSRAEMETFAKQFEEITGDVVDIDKAFKYDSEIKAWKLDNDYLIRYAYARGQQLGMIDDKYKKYVNDLLKDNVTQSVQQAIEAFTTGKKDARKELEESIVNYYTNLFNTDETALKDAKEEFSEIPESVRKAASAITSQSRIPPGAQIIASTAMDTEGNLAKTGKFAKDVVEATQILVENVNENLEETTEELTTAKLIQKSAQRDIDNILKGGIDAVKTYQKYNKDASQEELEEVFYSRINALNSVVDQVNDLMVGQFVGTEGKLFEVLYAAKAVDYNGVVQAGFDMVSVYAQIYAEMKNTEGRTQTGLNEAYAKLLTAADQQEIDAIEMLSNAQGMTYDALGQMLSKYNQSLEEWMSNPDYYGITAIGAGKIRITDWESFSSGLGLVGGTEEYIDAYKSFNDGVIEQNKKIKENIKSEINSIKDANPFDEINLTQMWATYGEALELALNDTNLGAIFHNGILTLTEDAKIPDILQRVGQVAASAGDLIPSELAELSDAIASFLENLADLISQGISGGLSHVDKNNLIEQARSQLGIDDLEFVQTADGFQLVETSALKLYDALKKVNSFAAGKLFEGLKEQLEEVNENFESSSALTAYISNTRQDILNTDNKVSNARKEQYAEELKIAKEILAVRSTSEDDSFNFMNQNIPAGQNNPLNYMASWKTAFDSIKQAKRSGSMDYKDFYNFVTEVGHLAEITGKAIPLGKKSVENSQQAADLITQAASQLKIVEKDGSYKINLSGLKQFGIDFAAGAQGMADGIDEGIHQMAKSQIDMLDGMIQLLETIVAMEKLGDIASGGDKDNVIDLHDILPEIEWDEQGNLIDIGKYAEDYKTIIQQIKDAAKENEDLAKGLKNTKINGFSLETIFNWSEEDMAKQGKDFMTGYAAYLQAMSQAALSGNYNEDDIANSIKQVLAESGATDFTIDTGKISIIFSGGEVTTIDWTDKAVKEIVDKYAKGSTEEAAHEKVQAALASYTAGKGTEELELEEILTLQHKLTIHDNGDKSVTVEAGGTTTTYNSDSLTQDAWMGALSAKTLENLGYTDNEITIEGETAKTTTTIGNQTDIKVECTNGVVKISGTGPSPDGKSSIPVEGSNIREWQDKYVDAYIKAAETVAPEKAKWTREQILWYELGIRVNTTTRIVDEKGRDYDINNDPAMRERLKELQGKSPEQLKDKIKDLGNGNIEVELDNGVKAIIDGASIEWDVKNKTYNQEKFDKQISNMLGLDTILQENIAGGITKGFESLSTTLEGLNAEPATNVANAIQSIGTNATTALTEVSKLVTELAKLNTLQSQSNSNNSNVPGPGKEKLTAKQYADKYGKGTIASGGSFEILGGAETSAENTVTDSSTTYTIKVDKVQIDASGASTSIAPGTHVKVADDSKVDIENSIMGVPSSLDPLDMTYIPKDLGQQQVPTGMSMTITNPIKAKITALEPILDDATSMGEEISGAIADGISSGESNITNAIGSIKTHIDELGSAATKIFADIKTILGSLQQHVSITGEISFETPFGKIGTKSGFRGENGVVTISVEGQEKIQEAKEEAEKPVSFTVTAIDLASNTIAKIANNLSKLTSKTIEITTNYTTTGRPPKTDGMTELPKATGNIGLAKSKGTLMGELGPELVVSNGRYFVAGQNGAEMVDLADDAIVFNHLQTEQLLKYGMSSGRGRAVTSERNAVAFARGNVDGGPAMASASAALNALKQLRAMWESLLGASVSDLGKGGGGGGGGSKVIDPKAWIDTVERWYNLMQEIARLEQQITHEEKLRAKLQSDFQKNGKAYYTSQKLSVDSLEQQIQAQEQLNLSREDYLDRRVAALKENSFGKIYQFDPETNQLEFRKDTNLNGFTNAMEFLTDLYGFNEQGKANYTNKQKYEILKANGFGEQMLYKDGMEIKADSDNSGDISDEEWESFYEQATEAFRDRMDEYAQATQSLRDEIQKGKDQLLELQTQVNEILQDMRDNQMDVENKVLDAIVDLREREIDALQDERDKLEESVNKYVDGLSNALDREQKMYQNQESQNDLDKQRRRLAILQRSGGSASDIANLQNDINQSERDMYFDLQQQQIDAIQEASQLELERMDTQIEIMNETLEFQKEYGLLWGEVYNVMSGSAAQITDFISGSSEFWSKSPLATSEEVNKIFFGAEQWTSYRDNIEDWNKVRDALFNQIKAADKKLYDTSMRQEFGENYDPNGKYAQIFEQSYNEFGDVTKASTAARSAYTADKLAAEEAERKRKEENERKRREQEAAAAAAAAANQSASASNGGDHTVAYYEYNSDNTKVRSVFRDGTKGPWKKTGTSQSKSAEAWIMRAEMKKGATKAASGGYANHGIYELGERGTETVFTASQTKVLRDNILSNRPSSLISLLKTYNEGFSQNHFDAYGKEIQTLYNNTSNNSGINIENATVNMNVQQLANDYDAKRAGEQALAEIMRIARKTSANNSIRR